jgi:hypothetical protein
MMSGSVKADVYALTRETGVIELYEASVVHLARLGTGWPPF